ncbi:MULTISPECIES: response regulator transcription factor [Flavobacterium]|jgi:DNA-binding response OmpR family regulator|uniref:DNA-binding response OmpR family regulator n=1 Tax=Flavobacterium lindanitolerans TaxID=428988 RepID=A0A497VE65_9FLAO|nr:MULTISPECIES: response regulator transcription factor [Flavobacterium]THD31613.1 MAG: response regulator transcription factor [Flavobacterium johnsoniae]MBC8645464.1 response regulator transcription factor [Flavobacterium lindanitolerans]MBL7867142.1 response regulator transcription factor [Flavobacterium lindanitolerans]MDQ7959679.1 response regulator transcription factor [Flavobacterium lindanitolerans]OJX52123.1 MAG: DNA-binding response regulator [Flavobacterium sp. 38-13]
MNILVAEDEIGISNFLKQGLEEENYTVTVASDGEKALRLALSQPFDLLLLDWMLPKLSGIEVCKSFRKTGRTAPILFLTAKDTVQETIEGLKAGANDYIKKPFSFEELLERIKVQFRSAVAENSYVLGPIHLDKEKHQVFIHNEEVYLTQKEFSLLEYLIKNKGTVCSRSQIIKEVWNIHFDYESGVIDVFINSIRKKLGLRKEEDYIKTVRGIGYIANEI